MRTPVEESLARVVGNTELVSGGRLGDEDATLVLNAIVEAGYLICPKEWFSFVQREQTIVFTGFKDEAA